MGWHGWSLGISSRAAYPRGAVLLARRLRYPRIDVVHTHSLDASLVGLLAARLATRTLGIVTAHHAAETPLYGKRRLEMADRFCMGRLANLVVAPTVHMRNTLMAFH